MSDLVIVKLSDCVCPVDGGRKDVILLCEKVTSRAYCACPRKSRVRGSPRRDTCTTAHAYASLRLRSSSGGITARVARAQMLIDCFQVAKEDIQVRFYEEKDDQVVWEGFGDFQPSQVHKQTAIWFRPPRYHTLEVTEPVRVFIQLRRPSDGAASEPLPFEYVPLDSGRPAYWSFRRNLAKKANYSLFNTILANDAQLLAKRQLQNSSAQAQVKNVVETPADVAMVVETNNNYSEVNKANKENEPKNSEEKSFNELINQVAELDEIYSETQARLLNSNIDSDKPRLAEVAQADSFDDARTYTSLQLAFKNPINIDLTAEKFDDVPLPPVAPPTIDVSNSNKRESDLEKLPPLPPKRAKKIETAITGSTHSIQLSGKQAENVLQTGSMQNIRAVVTVGRSQSFNLPRPRSQNELAVPVKKLPPTPSATLPNPKKRGFLSRLFGRKSKTPGASRESSAVPSKRNSFSSSKSLQVGATNASLGRSASNLSTRSYGDATSIHIPLKGTPPGSTENLSASQNLAPPSSVPPVEQNIDTVMCLDLTEAEHYALYMAMAPHATQSEFDEFSCYYAPVEGGKILTEAELLAKVLPKTWPWNKSN